jgi:hypothetical protein
MNDKLEALQQIISLSHAMLEQAQSASWDELPRLEASRRELIEAFFLMPVQVELTRIVSEGVKSILLIDQTIMELGRTEKLELEQVLLQIEHGKKAVKAYNF